MPPGAEQEQEPFMDDGDPHVRQQLDSINGDLMASVPDDDRFGSGVPDGQRANSIDFIQMTGLTRAPLHDSTPIAEVSEDIPASADLNPAAPVSFYEKGVADVDDGGPGGASGLADAALDSNLVPDTGSDTLQGTSSSPSAEAFKDIVAGLGSGSIAPEAATESAPEEAAAGLAGAISEGAVEERSASADLLSMLDAVDGVSKEESAAAESPASGGIQEQQLFTPEPVEVAPPANLDGATDDWDALLDSVSSGSAPAAPPTPSPGSEALVEAEQLMQELGQTGGDVSASVPPKSAATPSLLPTYTATTPSSPELDGELPFDYSATPARRRSKRHSRTARRGRKAIKLFVSATVLVTCIAAAYVYVVQPTLEQAEDLEAKAERLLSEAKYEEASKAYTKLSNDPTRGTEAQFQAAYVLTLEAPGGMDAKSERYRLALTRFASFVEANPQHPKRTRAQTLMGRLHYELAEYEEAISILRDQVNPLDDPQAALATYRYLARSYSQIADYEAAESAFLQAALLPGNYSVDTDYRELGGMFQTRADLAKTDGERVAFMNTAVDYWRKAIQQPGIEPGQKAALEEKLDWFVFQDSGAGADPMKDASPMAVEPEAKASVPPASSPERSPVDGGHEEEPGAEFPTLETTTNSAPEAE